MIFVVFNFSFLNFRTYYYLERSDSSQNGNFYRQTCSQMNIGKNIQGIQGVPSGFARRATLKGSVPLFFSPFKSIY